MMEQEVRSSASVCVTTTDAPVKKAKVVLQFHCHHINCSRSFKRRDRLEIHLRTHTGERPFICGIAGCFNSYARSQHLSRHIQRVHFQDNGTVSKELCPYCNLEFANPDSLKRHEKRFHTISSEGRLFKCPDDGCDEVFRKRQQLVAHREVDHAQQLTSATRCFKCPHEGCDKSFPFPTVLKRHLKIHQGYKCELEGCGQVLPTWTKLRKHKAVDHRKNLVCHICQSTFSTSQNLTQHLKIHLPESDKESIVCPREGCTRTFLYKKNLTQHIRSFHEGKQVFIRKKQKPTEERVKKRRLPRKTTAAAKLSGLDLTKNSEMENQSDPSHSETLPPAPGEVDAQSSNVSPITPVDCETSLPETSEAAMEKDCPVVIDTQIVSKEVITS